MYKAQINVCNLILPLLSNDKNVSNFYLISYDFFGCVKEILSVLLYVKWQFLCAKAAFKMIAIDMSG